MDRKDFLLEIGSEELPVGYVLPALDQLAAETADWLAAERLDHGPIRRFATPRRLAVLVAGLQLRQADREEELTGPPVRAAFQDGAPTKAAEGFARGHGVTVADLHRVETGKGEYLAVRKRVPGRSTATILAEGLPARIQALRFPKTMTWGDGSLRFARPIRWLVALLGDEPVPFRLGPLAAGSESRGHRQLAPGAVPLAAAADYEAALHAAHVEPDHERRREHILAGAREAAEILGGRLVEDDELLHTVAFLVEEPALLAGRFGADFLDMPREVVVTAMKSHQRYFSVEDDHGRLLPGFIVVMNGERPRPALVREGNERVLKARLEDARFYWEEDRRAGLAGLMRRLETVVWVEGFGSVAQRAERLRALAGRLAELLDQPELDREALDWAARYCKADLASEMIKDGKEFTRLQGYMGQEYARAEGVDDRRSRALFEHTLPRFAGDRLPEGPEGRILALADRLDAVAGLWAAGFAPTGSKDPYALRRQALAALRLLLEGRLPLDLDALLGAALDGFDVAAASLRPELRRFFDGRLESMLEEESVAPDVFRAVLATGESRVLDLRGRALALNALRGDPAFEKLVIGARRVSNILAKEGLDVAAGEAAATLTAWADGTGARFGFREAGTVEDAERALLADVREAAPSLQGEARARDYDAAYRRLAGLGEGIDRYFDGVMVNCEDAALRSNRLAFLRNLAHLFLHFADLSEVVLEGEREPAAD
ncbi:MAG: glycine--tRNA ligase subunit beta [Candidatus Krumholzibacteriota bacterium]|nr:glycine--tRNA ligase subunit beta [Candidatus Krumholzibacteriota bacterium]